MLACNPDRVEQSRFLRRRWEWTKSDNWLQARTGHRRCTRGAVGEQLAQEFLYKQIAAKLGIAFDTVQWHIRHIYQRLRFRSRSEAIAKYLRSGAIPPAPPLG